MLSFYFADEEDKQSEKGKRLQQLLFPDLEYDSTRLACA